MTKLKSQLKYFVLGSIFAILFFGGLACQQSNSIRENFSGGETTELSEDLPGAGIKVKPITYNLPEGLFITQIVNKALEKLGYTVEPTLEVETALMYIAMAKGDADYTPTFTERLHNDFYERSGGDEQFVKLGVSMPQQIFGYQIDKKTADRYNITSLEQLKDPKIAQLFDRDGNGKANITGCNPGWACALVIEHHLDAYELRDTLEHDQGQYVALIADMINRYQKGESVLFFAFLPYWLGTVLKPDEDTIWLEVPYTDLPEIQGDVSEKDTTVDGKNLGFIADRWRIIGNQEFIQANPAAKKLFEVVQLSRKDISIQSQRMQKEGNNSKDIERYADEWIEKNQVIFDGWIEEVLKEN
ncbi:MAG: glycine betaine/L-proline ABC transporter substrate-binding protein ProX [Cyanobacteria bacterium SBLK]|nr:glycine betaine/L-proline ABC transporter substrate-binding protein ProX [Cyanobacteria bacterium SBLK]